jgi:hypothetical protein
MGLAGTCLAGGRPLSDESHDLEDAGLVAHVYHHHHHQTPSKCQISRRTYSIERIRRPLMITIKHTRHLALVDTLLRGPSGLRNSRYELPR